MKRIKDPVDIYEDNFFFNQAKERLQNNYYWEEGQNDPEPS